MWEKTITVDRSKYVSCEVMVDTLKHILDILADRQTEEEEKDFLTRAVWTDQSVMPRVENFTRARLRDLEKQLYASESEDDFDKYKEHRVI